jgi:quinol monooxygenase YgiN
MIVVTGRVHVAAENRERFIAIATEMCSRSREEDACRGYCFYGDLEQDDRWSSRKLDPERGLVAVD